MAFPLENFITPGVTVIAVLLTNQLTYGRGNKEKLWELRRQAYSVILSELVAVERICDSADSYIRQDEVRYYESNYCNDHNSNINDHMAIVRGRFASDYLILSDAFIRFFDGFDEAVRGDYDDDQREAYHRFAAAMRQWRPRLSAQARSEMPFAGPWWRRFTLAGVAK